MIREGRTPTAPWLPSDRLLSIALTLHEQSRGACGHYMDEAYDGRGDWSAQTIVCSACAAEERYRAEHDHPVPGEKVFAMPNTTKAPAAGEVLPTFG